VLVSIECPAPYQASAAATGHLDALELEVEDLLLEFDDPALEIVSPLKSSATSLSMASGF
jgi:hypothetical protein